MYFFYGQNELRPNEFFYKIDIGLKKKRNTNKEEKWTYGWMLLLKFLWGNWQFPQETFIFWHTIGPQPAITVKLRHRNSDFGEMSAACWQQKLKDLLFQLPVTKIDPLMVIHRPANYTFKWGKTDMWFLISGLIRFVNIDANSEFLILDGNFFS